jgi:hypothetical protein
MAVGVDAAGCQDQAAAIHQGVATPLAKIRTHGDDVVLEDSDGAGLGRSTNAVHDDDIVIVAAGRWLCGGPEISPVHPLEEDVCDRSVGHAEARHA